MIKVLSNTGNHEKRRCGIQRVYHAILLFSISYHIWDGGVGIVPAQASPPKEAFYYFNIKWTEKLQSGLDNGVLGELRVEIGLGFKKYLDAGGRPSKELREELKGEIPLPADSEIKVDEKGKKWRIIDKAKNKTDTDKTYTVRAGARELKIYLDQVRKKFAQNQVPLSDNATVTATDLLFSTKLKFESDLDEGVVVSGGLQREFEDNGISLNPGAAVCPTEKGSRWEITDQTGKKYEVRKDRNKLNIYRIDGENLRWRITDEVEGHGGKYENTYLLKKEGNQLKVYDETAGIVWCGLSTDLEFDKLPKKLAQYCAPILWFSPDEPLILLEGHRTIQIPHALPCEKSDSANSPVVYYRISNIPFFSTGSEKIRKLFSIELKCLYDLCDFPKELNNGYLSQRLQQGLQQLLERKLRRTLKDRKKITLSGNATVSIEKESSRWRITDAGNTYIVECEGNKLNMYEVERVELTVEYFFYYRNEQGFTAHIHDIESAKFRISIEKQFGRKYRARIIEVIGAAHGSTWYANRLAIEDRTTSFPMTILVEEGKHASCPDRNADGYYTPGYDVNRRVNDAWGLRDVMGSEIFIGPEYRAAQVKQRNPKDRIFYIKSAYFSENYRGPAIPKARQVYYLKPLPGCCKDEKFWKEKGYDNDFIKKMKENKFHEDPDKRSRLHFPSVSRALKVESGDNGWEHLPLSWRYHQGNGLSMVVPLINFNHKAWLVVKPNIIWSGAYKPRGVDLLYTLTASRWFEWYLSAGLECVRIPKSVVRIPKSVGRMDDTRYNLQIATEFGIKLRSPVKNLTNRLRSETSPFKEILWGVRWGLEKLERVMPFAGFRFGVRTAGIKRAGRTALIFEVGGGAW